MANSPADRNLLFGILAVQMDFISRDQLIAAMNAWVLDKSRSLADILVAQQALAPARHMLLDALVQEHLKQHDNDPQKSLAAISSGGSIRQDLEQIADADVQASLVELSLRRKDERADPEATVSVGASTSKGQRFRIVRPHAEGGLGKVYIAHDEELSREVALKEIKNQRAGDAESRQRFVLEAEITGGLEHPGIVPVYGLGTYADGRPFYAMRFIKGDSLKDAIEKFHGSPETPVPALNLRKLLGRFIDVCQAMQYAHDRGVLHRDLKPGNIMLGKYGETLVVDWGLAKAVGKKEITSDEPTLKPASASGSAETLPGSAIGTPAYMSPEQAAGRLDLLGPASDVYSLGATLYCLLTGKPPIEIKDVAEVLRKVRNGEFPRPRQRKSDIDPALEAICLKAMALDSTQRYASPRAFADDVEHWLADDPVIAWPEPLRVKARRWMGRHRTLTTGAAATLAVGIVSLGITALLLRSKNDELERTLELSELHYYAAKISLSQQEWAVNNAGAAWIQLDDAPARPRGWEFYYLATLFEANQKILPDQRGPVAFSPDGKLLASWSRHGTLHLFDVETSRELNVSTGPGKPDPRALVFSAGGKQIIVAWGDGTVSRWDVETAKWSIVLKDTPNDTPPSSTFPVLSPDGNWFANPADDFSVQMWNVRNPRMPITLQGHKASVSEGTFSPDSKWFASLSSDETLRVWDVERGQEVSLFSSPNFNTSGRIAMSPDGTSLANSANSFSVFVWNLDKKNKDPEILKGHTAEVIAIQFSPDGKHLASASTDRTVRLWPTNPAQKPHVLRHTGIVTNLAFRPDGQRLATTSRDGAVRIWDVANGQELRIFKGHTRPVTAMTFSPDGKRLASASALDNSVRLWNLEKSQEPLSLRGYDGMLSRDGKKLACLSNDGTVRLWDITNGNELLAIKGNGGLVNSLEFSPDDRWLAIASGKTVRLWDISKKEESPVLRHESFVLTAKFNPDGQQLVTVVNGGASLWDLRTGQQLLQIYGSADGGPQRVAVSPDGTRVATTNQGPGAKVFAFLWHLKTGHKPQGLQGHNDYVQRVAFSPDGMQLASASRDGTVRLWDGRTGLPLHVLRGHKEWVSFIAFSPDNRRLASAGSDGTLRVWDTSNGKQMVVILGHTDSIDGLAFSPDGQRIVSASWDSKVRLWHAEKGVEIFQLRGHADAVYSVAFSGDGSRLVSQSRDGVIRIWEASNTTVSARLTGDSRKGLFRNDAK